MVSNGHKRMIQQERVSHGALLFKMWYLYCTDPRLEVISIISDKPDDREKNTYHPRSQQVTSVTRA